MCGVQSVLSGASGGRQGKARRSKLAFKSPYVLGAGAQRSKHALKRIKATQGQHRRSKHAFTKVCALGVAARRSKHAFKLIKATQKRAKTKYEAAKVARKVVKFFPDNEDLLAHLGDVEGHQARRARDEDGLHGLAGSLLELLVLAHTEALAAALLEHVEQLVQLADVLLAWAAVVVAHGLVEEQGPHGAEGHGTMQQTDIFGQILLQQIDMSQQTAKNVPKLRLQIDKEAPMLNGKVLAQMEDWLAID